MIYRVTPLLEGPDATDFSIEAESLKNPQQFVKLMDRHKALLFHGQHKQNDGESTTSVEGFGSFVADLQLTPYPYIGGAAPRTVVPVQAGKDILFTANESPPDQPIPFHHELAQVSDPPRYVFFYCETPPVQNGGGETPLIDSTRVFRFVREQHPAFLADLLAHNVRYVRTLPAHDDPTSPIGRSYGNAYGVSSREELDQLLSSIPGYAWEWLEPTAIDHDNNNNDHHHHHHKDNNASVRIITPALPAVRHVSDPNGHYVFQDTFANSIIAAYLGWQDTRNDRHEALRFGNSNMDRMPEAVLESIAHFMESNRVMHPWKQGDILAINNQLVMHSRNTFTGKRRILASIWGPARSLSSTHQHQHHHQRLYPSDPLVFGFWKVPIESTAEICYQAIQAGYRRLDCACDYGNEKQVGIGIARALRDGLCTRNELFITSKLWNTFHHPDHVPLALHKSLHDLQLSYLDEYLIHFPISMQYVPIKDKYPPEWTHPATGKMVLVPNDIGQTWAAMEALVDQGLVKQIGVCNFSTQLLRHLCANSRIPPCTLQIESHPHLTQEKLIRCAQEELGMRVTAFSILGASSYLELNSALTSSDLLIEHPVIQELAAIKDKNPAQILIRWALQRNTLPLCKTSSVARLSENRNVFDFYLTESEMRRISHLNVNRRYNDPGVFCEEAFGTFCPIYE